MLSAAVGAAAGLTGAFGAYTGSTGNPTSSFSTGTLAAPTGLAATVLSSGNTVRLSWTATASTWASGHRVYRATASGGPYTQVAQIAGRTTVTYDDSPPDGTYYYVVRAYYNGSGAAWESANSNQAGPVTTMTLDHFDVDPIAEQHSGRSFAVTVRAKTSSGQTIPYYNGTASFSTSSGSISPATSDAFVNGVLTQAVTITGAYATAQTISVSGGSPAKTGTSNAFTLHDWKYYFKKTTAYTGDANTCSSAFRKRDMEEGYAGSDPEETHTRAGSGTETLNFCSPTFAAGDTLRAGTTTVNAYIDGPSGSSCNISATLYKVSGGVATSLGSATRSITGTSLLLYTFTINNSAATLAAGDRLNVYLRMDPVKACSDSFIHYGGTTYRSHVALPGPGGGSYSDAVLGTSGLVSYWRLDEASGTTAADSKGTNTGTYVNGVTLGAASLLRSDSDAAASFDALNDYVSVPDSASLSPTAQTSFEAWVKPTDVGTYREIGSKDWILRVDNPGEGNQFSFFVNIGGAFEPRIKSGVVPATGTAYHVVGTYDGANVRIYVNGQLKGTQARTGSLVDGTGSLLIGGNGSWSGTVDDVAFYNVALSATQVSSHYDAR